LTFTEVAPFLGLTERATDRIVFTNSNEVAEDAKNRNAMRTVRGIDFDELTLDELRAISGWLRRQPITIPKPTPDDYQVKALTDIADTLARYDRAHVVMACGTGKTLVALWAAEHLKPKTVLVLVPSLTLLQQTLDEWSRHNTWGSDFTYLCVCSDPTVVSRNEDDPVRLEPMDLEFRVDTDPKEVRRFIKQHASKVKVIFSTYHSSHIVSEGLRGFSPVDIAVFDEAHKTTGPRGKSFAHALSQQKLAIRKRLFFTATPLHRDIRHRNRDGDFAIQSMDNPTVYGPRAHTLTFASAARQGIICNYKVVISAVDGQAVNDFVLRHGITLVQGDLIAAKWVANQVALERAVEKTDASHIITFHSKVSTAKEFSTDAARGIKQYLPTFSVFHVNGLQPSSVRKQILRDFRQARRSLITNARCLTEGIDVPAVDMVAFIDPRHSNIDIAQATGRAMRKPRGSDKTLGYIVVPLFLEREGDDSPEQALARSDFSDIAAVLNAMQEQDEDLVDIIRELQEGKGRGDVFNPRRLAERVEVLGPTIDLSQLRRNIFAQIVDSIGVSWDVWFGRLKAYKERVGSCRVPSDYKEADGYKLGTWVSNQRSLRTKLSDERRRRLDELGFVWSPYEADWEEGFDHLAQFKARVRNCLVPALYRGPDGYRLGAWVVDQRQQGRKGIRSPERRRRLDELGFVWNPREADWEEGFDHLAQYKARVGNCLVPRGYQDPDGYSLGAWVKTQRRRKNISSPEQIRRLDELGFVWNTREADWEEGFSHLAQYRARVGNCLVPALYRDPDGYSLGAWVTTQRQRKDIRSPEHKRRLDELGFVWNTREADWEEGFSHLAQYKARVGNCLVPWGFQDPDGYNLGQWVSNQRQQSRKGIRSPEQIRRLDGLGFVLSTREADWEEGFSHLAQYKARVGNCLVPQRYQDPDGYNLGAWVMRQRQRNIGSPERKRRLDELGLVWNAREADWEEGFSHLAQYKARVGNCRVPPRYQDPDGYSLGAWVGKQRDRRGIRSPEQMRRLNELGFVWNPHEADWEEGFSHLAQYKARVGNCLVPFLYQDPDGYKLGVWVGNQRQRKSVRSPEQMRRLNELGFVWNPR